MCFVQPLNAKNSMDQNSPFYQHVITRVIKHYLRDLTNFEKSNPAYSLVSNLTWKYFFKSRAFIQSHNIIELSQVEDVNDPEGVLITVSCRPKIHDLIIFYVPNIPLFGSEPYFYVEYLTTLHSLLLLQGFDSPAIFINKFPEICKESPMEYCLKVFIESLIKIVSENPNSKIVLMGDSLGATLILNYLSIKNNVFVNDAFNDLNNMIVSKDIDLNPFAVLLISPIVNFSENLEDVHCNDYLGQSTINNYGSFYCTDISKEQFSPSNWKLVEMWNRIVPNGGMVITFGDEELQSNEINEMCKTAFETNRVKIVKKANKGHCWPLMSFLTEETQDEKEDSCFLFAGMLSRMVLYQTENYRDPERSHEPMNLLTIDDDHL